MHLHIAFCLRLTSFMSHYLCTSITVNKCYVLVIGKTDHILSCTIHGRLHDYHVTSCRDSGIIINSNLPCGDYITDTVVRQHRWARLIHRCYCVLFDISSLFVTNVWSSHLLQMWITFIKNVQHRFTKPLPGLAEYSYGKCLSLLNLPRLELHRLRFDLTWCYEIFFGLTHINCKNSFKLKLLNWICH